ncbi:serine/arginine repetitive matrix protein 1 [Pseudoliparis swirei]|uniref:serine/arginine repetitive matrix protein 1 n=1 Tax=Pseudoliparis swirei TaxID=2059687 RepID=UPI0024BDC268|nr:serine/arginine repetitive matrix protein 1 [Pseudoliparis swirei]
MVSKEPNHLLTGRTNGKSTLADKLPGTMTVRSVLLNRDSPDIESRLKRRRNRTHQVRFKDLEDGSSSSGNSGTGENNSHQRPAPDCDSPHPLRKHGSRSPKPWTARDGPRTQSLPGQTSVVGSVRGDMESTIEVVAAFLARAPPHPLTPGPTRRCWAPPQINSLTLPMTRRPSTSTSTAIQTSPCLKKPQPLSSTHTHSHSLGDSLGMDGDDEHDSQDEYLAHNHVLGSWSKDQNGPPGPGDRAAVERRSRASRTDIKSAVSLVKNSRHSCPPSVFHNTEPFHGSSASCRDGPKRQGSSTPSMVRRRKRLNRTASDPGKEVHYCTIPTQTESHSPSPPPSNTNFCTTQHSCGMLQSFPSCTIMPHAKLLHPYLKHSITSSSNLFHSYPNSLQNTSSANTGITPYSSPVPKLKSCTSPPPLVQTYASTLPNAQTCATPTKAVPLYSSKFRAAPPYTPPSQAPYNAQDKRGIRLPPPPPPPPPYTPRKTGSDPPGPAVRTPVLTADGKAGKGDKDEEKEEREDIKCTDSPKLCERASSLKHRAQTPPVAVMKEEKPASSSPAKACFKSSCLSSAQAQLGVLHKMLCSGPSARPNTPNRQCPAKQQSCSGARGRSESGERPTAGPLTATQADTLRQVQEILGGLVSGARCKLDPSRMTEKLLGPNGPLHDIRNLQTQLQSLEGVLETSQNTIKVLLDVIQDLEKKEAEREGRHSYRTGQDIENCGTCRDCACIIYSVEHDFRLQEGQVVRTWKVGDPPEGSPQTPTPQPSTPNQQDSPQPVRPPATTRKNRKKCFWFL